VGDQVSPPYKTTGKILVLFLLHLPLKQILYEGIFKVFQMGAAIYTAVVVAGSTGIW
jgi:hypothetical protein